MFKDVLLAVDLNDASSWESSLPKALEMRGDDGRLHVITVVPDFGMSIVSGYFPENYEKEVGEKVLAQLKGFVGENVSADVPVRHIVGSGNVYESILRTASEISADLIVMAAGRPDLKEYLLGPNAARVARHATASVLIVR